LIFNFTFWRNFASKTKQSRFRPSEPDVVANCGSSPLELEAQRATGFRRESERKKGFAAVYALSPAVIWRYCLLLGACVFIFWCVV
jgi:hypothetical protein